MVQFSKAGRATTAKIAKKTNEKQSFSLRPFAVLVTHPGWTTSNKAAVAQIRNPSDLNLSAPAE
jgi:hypothetical protein